MKKILFFVFMLFVYGIPLVSYGEEDGCGEQGECIEGDCDNGMGTYIFYDGSSYTGGWQDGLPEGSGILNPIDDLKDEE